MDQWNERASCQLLKKFSVSDYCSLLMEAYEKLQINALYKSSLHGLGHIERVMLLAALIAWKEELSLYETRLLLLCCSYHDIGRVNDKKDDEHGSRSALMMENAALHKFLGDVQQQHLTLVYAAVAAHSLSDAQRGAVAEIYGVDSCHMQIFERIACCLKDADNLDRVRLRDLDPGRLRNRSSKTLVLIADRLYAEHVRVLLMQE